MVNSGILGIFSAADVEVVPTKPPLFTMSLAAITDLERHLILVEGRYAAESVPAVDAKSAGIEMLLSRAFADRMGVQPGETYLAYDQQVTLRLTVVGSNAARLCPVRAALPRRPGRVGPLVAQDAPL